MKVARELLRFRQQRGYESGIMDEDLASWKLKTGTALIMDAVSLFREALKELPLYPKIEADSLNCSSSDSWKQGLNVITYMKRVGYEIKSRRCLLI